MAGAGEEPPVEFEPLRIEARARAVDEAAHRRAVRAPGEDLRGYGVQEQHPGDAGKEDVGEPRKGRERPVDRHEQVGGDAPVEAHPGKHRRPRRVAHREARRQPELRRQIADRLGHPRQGEPPAGQRIGEAVARQIGCDDPEFLRQQGRQTPPRMGGGAGAVQEQEHGCVRRPKFLQVPPEPRGLHEAARGAVGPVAAVALPFRPVFVVAGQGQADFQAVAARTAALRLPASAWGSGQ